MIKEGLTYTSCLTVKESDTAIALGSGDMSVLATPRMMALMENAAMLSPAACRKERQQSEGISNQATSALLRWARPWKRQHDSPRSTAEN